MPTRTARPSRAQLPAALRRALRETFGFDRLRPGQDEAIRRVLAGRSVFAVMPTGERAERNVPLVILRKGVDIVLPHR